METKEPRGKQRKFTDAQLRGDLGAGLKPAEIARKYEVSPAAVSKRINRLQLTTVAAAVVAPQESVNYARHQLDAMEQLLRGLERVNLLMEACDEWLRDPHQPERYDVGPRAGEVLVHYEVEISTDQGPKTLRRKKPLSELLGLLEGTDDDGARFVQAPRSESRHADPRELVLKTCQESRQTVSTVADLARMLADHRAMTALREAIISEVAKVDPDVASRIAEAVRRSVLLHAALGGPGALSPAAPTSPA